MQRFLFFFTIPGQKEQTDGKQKTLDEVIRFDNNIEHLKKPGFKMRIEQVKENEQNGD